MHPGMRYLHMHSVWGGWEGIKALFSWPRPSPECVRNTSYGRDFLSNIISLYKQRNLCKTKLFFFQQALKSIKGDMSQGQFPSCDVLVFMKRFCCRDKICPHYMLHEIQLF